MADQNSLRMIGLSFGAVTAAVMLVAALLVAEASRGAVEQAPPRMASTTTANS